MNKLLTLIAISLLTSGCAHINTSKESTTAGPKGVPVTTKVQFHGTSFLANSVFKSLGVDSTTKTTASLLKITGGATEPNPEAITASAEGLGSLIGAATAATAKGMGIPSLPKIDKE